ncbi:glutathione S-transferase family protein [Ancylobacter rudongensis]|uniref:Glutathione S-transferase n=1 Tax=Ancylobacter rudongensis TaxID=177413 RepID=A0A1G4UFX4_9HYPH|nr:glutathione S-transferase [Ancylobacter rudongensis]SCW92477.1 Glutathione S-transferase [Ancylobacter rudongensis]
MHLVGMLDSPYVRRVAVSLTTLGLPFTHESVSVFRHYERFQGINPVVKAPTLITDGGVVLMDSTLIIEHAEKLAGRSLVPDDLAAHARAQRIIGLALAACEKSVQIVYENQLRPQEKRHQPWLDRVNEQLLAAYRLLDDEIGTAEGWLFGAAPLQADITAAIGWTFTTRMLPDLLPADAFPALARLAARAEAQEAFKAWPYDG